MLQTYSLGFSCCRRVEGVGSWDCCSGLWGMRLAFNGSAPMLGTCWHTLIMRDRALHWPSDKWEFPKIRGTLFGVPYIKDPTISGTTLGSPCLRQLPNIEA